jgi:hypothetical protein
VIMPRHFALMLGRIVERIARLSPPRHRDLVRGMVAELDSIADPAEQTRFALGAIAGIARLVLSGYTRPATTAVRTGGTMRFPLKTRTQYDKAYFRMVGLALLPALGVSFMVILVGGMLGGSESTVDRISQVVSFPIFLAACHYIRARQPPTTTSERP